MMMLKNPLKEDRELLDALIKGDLQKAKEIVAAQTEREKLIARNEIAKALLK